MYSQSSYLFGLVVYSIFTPEADALAWPEPTPDDFAVDTREWSPWPTGQPFNPLERRQDNDNSYRTCGYLGADPDFPLTCEGTSVCVTDTLYAVAGCCDPNNVSLCQPYTACFDEDSAEDCGLACANDPQLLLCTRRRNTVCLKISFDYLTTTYTKYLCGDSSLTAVAAPTTLGQEVESEDGSPVFSNALGVSAGFVVDDSISESDDDDDDDGSNIGAIVGGVIGGLAVLAALIGGLAYLFYRNKRQKRNQAPAAAAAAATNPYDGKIENVAGGGFAPGGGSVSTAGQMSPTYENKTISYYPPVNADPHQSIYGQQSQLQPWQQPSAPFYQPTSTQQAPPQLVNFPPDMRSVSSNQHMSYMSPTSTSPVPQYEQPVQQPVLQQPVQQQPVQQQQQQQHPQSLSMPSMQSQTAPQEQQKAFQLDGTQVDKPTIQEATVPQEEMQTPGSNQRVNEAP